VSNKGLYWSHLLICGTNIHLRDIIRRFDCRNTYLSP